MTQTADPFAVFNRSCTVTVGTVQIQNIGQQVGLDVWFQVKRSLKPNVPNTCDLKLYNLAKSTRQSIEQYTQTSSTPAGAPGAGPVVPVQIQAGYVGNASTIFLGEMRSAQTVLDGDDYVTELSTGDADQAAILARSSASFGTGANAYAVAQKLISDMGCGAGNIATVASVLKSTPMYGNGYVLKGASLGHLVDLATSCGLEVSLQGGVLQWLTRGQPLGGQAYSLSSATGLYESPNLDTKGILNCKTALLPGIAPGLPIVLNALFVQGLFRVTSIETTGATGLAGNEWSHSIEAKRYGLSAS